MSVGNVCAALSLNMNSDVNIELDFAQHFLGYLDIEKAQIVPVLLL